MISYVELKGVVNKSSVSGVLGVKGWLERV